MGKRLSEPRQLDNEGEENDIGIRPDVTSPTLHRKLFPRTPGFRVDWDFAVFEQTQSSVFSTR
jgi:hypothetical protein